MTAPPLAFDTEHGRYYKRPGTHAQVPSITNILNMKAKPLFRAGMKEAARYAAENRATLATLDQEQAYTLCANPPRREDSPSAIGDIVHNWIDRYIKGNGPNPTDDDVRQAPQTAKWTYERFLRFVTHYRNKFPDFEFIDSEFTVWSDKYGYAGTADGSLRMNGRHILADWKTGNAVYPEVAMQLAAISHADVVVGPDGTERPLGKYDGYAALHLRPRSFALHPIDHVEEAFLGFLGLKQVFDWNVQYAHKSVVFAPKQTA